MMNAKEINQTFDLSAYVGAFVQLTKKVNYHVGPCPMCGGRDRFTIKQKPTGAVWHCRKCAPDGWHTAIDFVMSYHGLDFKQALKKLGGETQKPATIAPRMLQPAPVQVAPDQEWQAGAWRQVDAACDRLLGEWNGEGFTGNEEGEPGGRYLTERGITRAMMNLSLLGCGEAYGRPAVFIPYLDAGNMITALKFRFIDQIAQTDKGRRYAMLAGSMPYLFGLQNIQQSDNTLLFVEGELNAISIMQTIPDGVAVISAGSESNGCAAILQTLVNRFDRLIIWMDNPIKADEVRARVGRDAKLLQSPNLKGIKWDANEMLKAGLLADFLTRTLSVECYGIPAQLEQVPA